MKERMLEKLAKSFCVAVGVGAAVLVLLIVFDSALSLIDHIAGRFS